MFNIEKKNSLKMIRGDFFIEPSEDESLCEEGLKYQIVNSSVDEDGGEYNDDIFELTEHTIYFSPTRRGWKKAYQRLRETCRSRIFKRDNIPTFTTLDRLEHKRLCDAFFAVKPPIEELGFSSQEDARAMHRARSAFIEKVRATKQEGEAHE